MNEKGVKGMVGQLLGRARKEEKKKEKQHSDTLLGVCWRGTWRRSFAVIISHCFSLWPSMTDHDLSD